MFFTYILYSPCFVVDDKTTTWHSWICTLWCRTDTPPCNPYRFGEKGWGGLWIHSNCRSKYRETEPHCIIISFHVLFTSQPEEEQQRRVSSTLTLAHPGWVPAAAVVWSAHCYWVKCTSVFYELGGGGTDDGDGGQADVCSTLCCESLRMHRMAAVAAAGIIWKAARRVQENAPAVWAVSSELWVTRAWRHRRSQRRN